MTGSVGTEAELCLMITLPYFLRAHAASQDALSSIFITRLFWNESKQSFDKEQQQNPERYLIALVLITSCFYPHMRFPQEHYL